MYLDKAAVCGNAATPVADAMTPEQKYLFDLNGFIIIRGVLSEEEIAAAHAAIDAHTPLFKERAEKALRNTDEQIEAKMRQALLILTKRQLASTKPSR